MNEHQPYLFEIEPTREELLAEYERLRLAETEALKISFEFSVAKAAIQEALYIPPSPGSNPAFS